MDEQTAHKIARYLFLHKWLAASYSEELEDQLVQDIIDVANDDIEED
jgi:hypothetical protein